MKLTPEDVQYLLAKSTALYERGLDKAAMDLSALKQLATEWLAQQAELECLRTSNKNYLQIMENGEASQGELLSKLDRAREILLQIKSYAEVEPTVGRMDLEAGRLDTERVK